MEPENKRESFADVINGSTPVLVDFTAEWCGPCRMMKPILHDLHQKMGDKVRILKIDVDRNPAVAGNYRVSGVPTLILFQNGNILWRQAGVVPANQLEKVILQHSSAK
ncbi:MAG: thioredoxin [Bacteroidetes bacterium]|nr:thioredoxin [Bacteroidota bacterium]